MPGSDPTLLRTLGERLARHRLDRGLTQAALAHEAGVSKSTVERLEAGGSTSTTNLLRVLRVLDLLAGLDALVPQPPASPIALLRGERGQRKRARSAPARDHVQPRDQTRTQPLPDSTDRNDRVHEDAPAPTGWTWGENA